MAIYTHNAEYFNTLDSPDKAYWVGFLLADGGVYKGQLWLNLSKKDRVQLENFRKSITSSHPIKEKTTHVMFYIRSKLFVDSLTQYGITERKTFSTKLPKQIPEPYMKDFIRGYFDGDGCITYNKKRNTKVFSLTGTFELLDAIQNILVTKLKLPKNKLQVQKNSFTLAYGGNHQVTKIFEYLYNNSSLCLERKRNRFIELEMLVERNRGRIGRPKGAKDKQQRKRRIT